MWDRVRGRRRESRMNAPVRSRWWSFEANSIVFEDDRKILWRLWKNVLAGRSVRQRTRMTKLLYPTNVIEQTFCGSSNFYSSLSH